MSDTADLARSFRDAETLNRWLAKHHARADALWVRLYKKGSGIPSVDWNDCVRTALAWGWIDGLKRSGDQTSWLLRLTPRRPRSEWSERNRLIAEELIAAGDMQPVGLSQVEAAKSNGQWDAAYSGSATMKFPEDFLAALRSNPGAHARFEMLKRTEQFQMYRMLQTARTTAGRNRRIARIVARLRDN